MTTGRDIVCLSTTNWGYPWGSRQQLMTRFARDNRVLFVEYQASILRPAGTGRQSGGGGALRDAAPRLHLYTPPRGLPGGYYSAAVNAVNQHQLARNLRAVTAQLGFKDLVLWIYPPCSLPLVGRLGERVSVYHAIDLYKEETGNARRRRIIAGLEERYVPAVDLVFASSPPILEHLRPLNARIALSPSAADDTAGDGLEAVAGITGPSAGFVGTIDDRFDHGLVDDLARRHPEVSFVLVGPTLGRRAARATAALARRANVRVVGRVDPARARAYIRAFDVCLLPYRQTPFTNAISPIKVFEYLREGKPVVAVALAGLAGLEDVVTVARDGDAFARGLVGALAGDTPGAATRRSERARDNTWSRRFDVMAAALAARLAEA